MLQCDRAIKECTMDGCHNAIYPSFIMLHEIIYIYIYKETNKLCTDVISINYEDVIRSL